MAEKFSILVVEDNPDILDSVRLTLQYGGFEVIATAECQTAYDYLMLNRPDLILTDLSLPQMTGLEFIHLVRRMPAFDDLPIIAMSAFEETYLLAALRAGASRTLHKPEGLDGLIETINSVIRETKSSAASADARLDVAKDEELTAAFND